MKMEKSKIKTCKFPNCSKEVPTEKYLFCIEHDRYIREKIKISMGALSTLTVVGLGILAKNVKKKL